MTGRFRYERSEVGDDLEDPSTWEELTRSQLAVRIFYWVRSTEIAIQDLEAHPGEWVRITGFAFYRAVLRDENQEVSDV